MLFCPRPATSKGRSARGIRRKGMRTAPNRIAIPLTFAFLLRIVGVSAILRPRSENASAYETPAGNPRLPERVHPAARLCAEPRRNRPPFRPLFARDGAQAPHEPAGKGLHQAGVEPEPVGGDGPDPDRRPRGRAAAARLRGGRPAHRSRRVERNHRRARKISSASATPTCCASAATR